ncbi:hypothetical protein [Rhodococcus sp. NPDC049939]|uniref:hypothetical protein n=1 Tax=Rhodococcus sp. NPDC049939 TaxID=3155511 RepID=UPI0033E30596
MEIDEVAIEKSAKLPTVSGDLEQQWPQRLRYGALAFSVLTIPAAGLMVRVAIDGVAADDLGFALGFAGGAVLMVCVFFIGLENAGFRSIGLSRKIKHCTDVHGIGIQIPMGNAVPLMVVMLGGVGVYCLTAAASWYFGMGESLMPAGRDSGAGALYVLIIGGVAVATIVLLLIFRTPTVISVYPNGIRRHARKWRGLSIKTFDKFLTWDEIGSITADSLVVRSSWHEVRNPLIKLQTVAVVPPSMRLPLDSDEHVTIAAHLHVAEPNTLLSLLLFLKDNPDQRGIVAGPDARELLTPPPLRERFRAARLAKKGAPDA